MILDVRIGEKRKETRFLIGGICEILTLGNLLPAVREIFVSFSPVQMFEGNIHVFLIPPNYID